MLTVLRRKVGLVTFDAGDGASVFPRLVILEALQEILDELFYVDSTNQETPKTSCKTEKWLYRNAHADCRRACSLAKSFT